MSSPTPAPDPTPCAECARLAALVVLLTGLLEVSAAAEAFCADNHGPATCA